ncbi:hypothetical protein [Paucibacter soli]|uniref:hypothetical protein n=1 Tax=Paucibacter soli TaxID=3133433 RepID=UPI003096EDE7
MRARSWLAPVWQVALADWRERSRGRGFVLALLLCGALAGLVLRGDIMLAVGGWRGAHNAAWVGAQMALVFNTMMSLFGYFLVKGGVQRDAASGLADILASTGLGALRYMAGKWLSHLMLLLCMLLVMLAMALLQQFFVPPAGLQTLPMGSAWQATVALLGPFVVLCLPLATLLAALSLVFESQAWLRGALGNGLVFLVLVFLMSQAVMSAERAAPEPLGMGVLVPDMQATLRAQVPQAKTQGYTLGGGFTNARHAQQVFVWTGMRWTAAQVLRQWLFLLPAGALLLLAAGLHARAVGHGRQAGGWADRLDAPERAAPPLAAATPRGTGMAAMRAQRLLAGPLALACLGWAELRLLLRQPRWWQLGALGLLAAGAWLRQPAALHDVMLASLAWATLMLAPAAGRAAAHGAGALLGSCSLGARSQRWALLLAGCLLCLLLCSGAMLGMLALGRIDWLLASLAACLFLPALLLSLGAWSGGAQLGEIVGVLWLMVGWQGLTPLDPLAAGALAYLGLAVAALVASELVPRRRLEAAWA